LLRFGVSLESPILNAMTHLDLLAEEASTIAYSSGHGNNVANFVEDETYDVELHYMDEDIFDDMKL
jgi:hypothetical protein